MLFVSLVALLSVNKKIQEYIKAWQEVAMILVRVIGLLGVIGFILTIAFDTGNTVFTKRATGPYAVQYWYVLLGFLILPHLYWFEKIRKAPWRLLVAVLMLCSSGMFLQEFIVLQSNFHQEYGSNIMLASFGIKNLIRITIFSMVVLLISLFRKRIQNK